MHLNPFQEPPGARLVIAAMWSQGMEQSIVAGKLECLFGKITRISPVFNFSTNCSNYYEKEMGGELQKCFIEIEGVQPRASLLIHKCAALTLEREYLESGCRRLNVDPMLVALENVVIATTKMAPHRVYLGQGIFADLALLRRCGNYEPMPWTYRDYVEHRPFFEEVSKDLRTELKKMT